MAMVGALTMLGWMLIVALLPDSALAHPRLRGLLLLTACLVLIRVLDSAFSNLLYAKERSAFISVYGVVKRYLTLVPTIGVLLALARSAEGVFAATIAAEVVSLLWIGSVVVKDNPIYPARFSHDLFVRMVVYGVPMVGVEVAGAILGPGDRYVIQQLHGVKAVGVYSASYNLCEYIKGSTMAALSTAVAPMYMRVWEREGRVATERFLGRFARSYIAFSFLIAALVTANATDMVMVLASARYIEGTTIVPWVIGGMALDS
ncbi:MAG: oligosaccharide flippase family protein [Rudaea sp.]|uniref:lipopolysaccharide biosynthesis protein n=1 Tax=Rudaea sp. TaxID=2136325 RepID=UPI0039E35EBD